MVFFHGRDFILLGNFYFIAFLQGDIGFLETRLGNRSTAVGNVSGSGVDDADFRRRHFVLGLNSLSDGLFI